MDALGSGTLKATVQPDPLQDGKRLDGYGIWNHIVRKLPISVLHSAGQ